MYKSDYTGLQLAYNRTFMPRTAYLIKYIVIHDTANTDVGADVHRHFNYFNTGNRRSSADFFVDDDEILQVNDYYRYYTWHCGDGGENAPINNRNSVGVEICVNRDGNYKKAVDNAIIITKQLMSELDIDIDHVVRHKDASGKNCPQSMSEADWKAFKNKLK